jgi:hypothetical protein
LSVSERMTCLGSWIIFFIPVYGFGVVRATV